MKNSKLKITGYAVVISLFATLGGTESFAQSVHDEIRPMLVYLHARGQLRNSQFIDSYATGSMVSDDGLVLTVHHLVRDLGDNVVPETVTVNAVIGKKNGVSIRAAIVDAFVNTDLMLLKLPPDLDPYATVSLGNANEHDDLQDIYTSGFPQTMNYRMQQGKIEARSGPGGYLWTVGIPFLAGQSGSPVYDEGGNVIGIVKGSQDNPGGSTTHYMIPIEFADALLAQVRLREIREAMAGFELLRKKFDWTGEVDTSTHVITIIYEKVVSGEPHVASVNLKIRPKGLKDGQKDEINQFSLDPVNRTALYGPSGGAFELQGDALWDRVEEFRQIFDFDEITELEVQIVPVLTDGERLRRKTIVIEY